MESREKINKYLERLAKIENSDVDERYFDYYFSIDDSFSFGGLNQYIEFAYYVMSKTGQNENDLTNDDILTKFYEMLEELMQMNDEFYYTFQEYFTDIMCQKANSIKKDIIRYMDKVVPQNDRQRKKKLDEEKIKLKDETKEQIEKINSEKKKCYQNTRIILKKIVGILGCFNQIKELLRIEDRKESRLTNNLNEKEFYNRLLQGKSFIELETEMIFFINKLSKVLQNLKVTSFIFSDKGYVVDDRTELRKVEKSNKMKAQLTCRYLIIQSFLSYATELVRRRSITRIHRISFN